MYKCCKCGKISPPKEKFNLKVVQTRKREYKDEETGKSTYGWEIVKEEIRCNECLNK